MASVLVTNYRKELKQMSGMSIQVFHATEQKKKKNPNPTVLIGHYLQEQRT